MSEYKSLDKNTLINDKSKVISSQESLNDVKHIEWSEDVLKGENKVIIESFYDKDIKNCIDQSCNDIIQKINELQINLLNRYNKDKKYELVFVINVENL